MNTICAVSQNPVVDDQPDLIDALRLLLKREDIHVDSGRLTGGGPVGSRRRRRSICC